MKTLQPNPGEISSPLSYSAGRLLKALIFLITLLFFGIIATCAGPVEKEGIPIDQPDKPGIEVKPDAIWS